MKSTAQIAPELWDGCFADCIEGRWWYETVEASGLEDQFTFLYAIIQEEENAVGIAPLFLMDLSLSLVAPPSILQALVIGEKYVPALRPRILFVGSPFGDEGRVGILPGADRRSALMALQCALETKARELRASILVWKDFPDSFAGDLNWIAGRCRLFQVTSFPGTVVDLPTTHRKDDYFAALKGSRRQDLRRMLRRSAERIAVDVEVIQNPDASTLDEFFALFWQTYERAPTKFERLDRRFFEIIAQKHAAHFVILRDQQSRAMVAFMLCLCVGDRIINKFGGLDYNRPRHFFLNYRLWDAALDWALERGAASIQSGQTGYAAKIEVGHKLVPLRNYCRHRNFFVHQVLRALGRRISWQTLDHDLASFAKADASGP